jgi:cyclopropane-fatty-acyl-phospholipid synthase
MLDQLLVNQVRRRVEASGLPFVVELWNGEQFGSVIDAAVRVRLHQAASLKAMADPSLGTLARAYVEGAIDLDGDIRDILALGDRLCNAGDCTPKTGSDSWKWWRHTRSKDRRNIQYHYDVSNDFYGLWLDKRRVYSCAYFKHPDMSLDDAQVAKLDHICRKLDLQPDEQLLDIGCGWGGLILHAARCYGVEALGITLSEPQAELANERIRAAGLEGRCRAEMHDYREVDEAAGFDKLVSVGMFEHVGLARLQEYFAKAWRLLRPGGVFLNHGIGASLARPLPEGPSFIDRYVFPDGELLPIATTLHAAESSGFEIRDLENLREHYTLTLRHWVRRLEARREEAVRLTDEVTYRVWRLYMAACAYSFRTGRLNLYQTLLSRPAGDNSRLPLTRADWYIN